MQLRKHTEWIEILVNRMHGVLRRASKKMESLLKRRWILLHALILYSQEKHFALGNIEI